MIVGLFIYFWRDSQKHAAAYAAKRKEQEKTAAETAEALRKHYLQRSRHHPPATRSPVKQPIVATPRKVASTPIKRAPTPYSPPPTPAPAPAPTSDVSDVLLGMAVGYAISSLTDDRPSESCTRSDDTSFSSGGGGDFGGGGASGSWDDNNN